MHVDLKRLHLQYFFFHTDRLLNISIKRKTDYISTIIRRMITADAARVVGLLQHYVSLTLPVCIGPRSLNADVRNDWRPENDEFSFVYRKL